MWKVLTQGSLAALGLHALFVLLFWQLGAGTMALINVAGLPVYALIWQLLSRRQNLPAITVVWFWVHVHAALSVYGLGWDSGFHYYLLTFIPVIFVSKTQRVGLKMLLLVSLCCFYVLLDATMRDHLPAEHIAAPALALLRYLNIATTFLVLGFLAYYYFRQVGESEARLRVMATTDPLTGLSNRRRVMEFAHYEVVRRKRADTPLCIVMADIDHFKGFNDCYGHETGDRVLQMVADVWRATLREQDTIARWGGEEFMVVMPGADLESARMVADRLREAVAATPVDADGRSLTVCMTFGVSQYRPFESIEACIARADSALYVGKSQGRNRVVTETLPNTLP